MCIEYPRTARYQNALCDGLIVELNRELLRLDADDSCAAIVITGSEKAFAGIL